MSGRRDREVRFLRRHCKGESATGEEGVAPMINERAKGRRGTFQTENGNDNQ